MKALKVIYHPGNDADKHYTVQEALETRYANLDFNGFSLLFDDNTGIKDDSGNEQLIFQKTTDAVNQWDMTNAATGGKPNLATTGEDTNIIGRLDGKGTGGIEIKGTATNDSAAAGYVGQHISSTVASGSAVGLSSGTPADVTSISLTAGDWDVRAIVNFSCTNTTTISNVAASISTTSATEDTNPGRYAKLWTATDTPGSTTISARTMSIPETRISLNSTTTVYLVATGGFGASTLAAWGSISARRVR